MKQHGKMKNVLYNDSGTARDERRSGTMTLPLTSAGRHQQISGKHNIGMLFCNSMSHSEPKRQTYVGDTFAANFHRLAAVSTVTMREADIKESSVLAQIAAGILE